MTIGITILWIFIFRLSVWNCRFPYHTHSVIFYHLFCLFVTAIFRWHPNYWAEHSDFNFIQFVFTIYYLSVYCVLTFGGYLVDMTMCIYTECFTLQMVFLQHSNGIKDTSQNIIYRYTRTHTFTFFTCCLFQHSSCVFYSPLVVFIPCIHSFLLACLTAWTVVIFLGFVSFAISFFLCLCLCISFCGVSFFSGNVSLVTVRLVPSPAVMSYAFAGLPLLTPTWICKKSKVHFIYCIAFA